MFEYVPFEKRSGSSPAPDLKLFILSTCAFCEQAKRFLEEYGLPYSFIQVDRLPADLQRRLPNEFAGELDSSLRFPSIVIDDAEPRVGYDRGAWKDAILGGKPADG